MSAQTLPPTGAPRRHYVVLIVGIALVLSYVVGIIVSGMKPQLGPPPLASSLGARVDLILDYQEAFLDVVLWGMGLVGTLAVLLVGYSWFTTRETYERDLQALKDQIEAGMLKQATDLENMRQALRAEIDGVAGKVTENVRKALATIDDQQSDINATKKAVYDDLLEIQVLRDSVANIEQELLSTRCSALMESARKYGGTIAIMDLTQVLFSASQMKHDAVDWVWVALQHAPIVLQGDSKLEFKHLKDLHDTIANIPGNKHEELAKRVLGLIRARPEWKNSVPEGRNPE